MDDEIVLALQPGRHGEIYAGVERGSNTFHQSLTDGLFRSTDDGATWTTLGTGLTETSPQSIVELSDGTLFIGSQYGKLVLRLSPGDTVWQDLSTGLPVRNNIAPLYALLADRAENLYAGNQKGLFKSTNRGNNWQRIGTEIADTTITALAMAPGGRLYAATILHGVYASDDNGSSWRHLGDPPGTTGFDVLAVDSSGVLNAGSAYAGIYRASEVLSVPSAGNSTESALMVYPNPAGANATLEFTMAAAGTARLGLYSATGQQVAVIGNGIMARGGHRIELDLSGYAPGAYHLRLETAQGAEQVGVVLVR
jgi:hypothetical protein